MTNNHSKDKSVFSEINSFKRQYQYSLGVPKSLSNNIESTKMFNYPKWYVDRDCDSEIREWLTRNYSGTLLVTGYRGVGKSSCVDKALSKIEESYGAQEYRKTIQIEQIRINFTTIFTLNTLSLLIIRR